LGTVALTEKGGSKFEGIKEGLVSEAQSSERINKKKGNKHQGDWEQRKSETD
jgi:hypothetical protein